MATRQLLIVEGPAVSWANFAPKGQRAQWAMTAAVASANLESAFLARTVLLTEAKAASTVEAICARAVETGLLVGRPATAAVHHAFWANVLLATMAFETAAKPTLTVAAAAHNYAELGWAVPHTPTAKQDCVISRTLIPGHWPTQNCLAAPALLPARISRELTPSRTAKLHAALHESAAGARMLAGVQATCGNGNCGLGRLLSRLQVGR